MRSKILSSLALFVSLSIIYVTMSSDKNGKYNSGTTCGSCHGNANSATTSVLTGLPSSYVTGQTYPLTFTITNATLTKSGFNILATGGTFIAGTGSKVNTQATQITHSAVSSSLVYNFSWKAPATPTSVTFKGVGNAVNGDNNDASTDQWNTMTDITINGSFPTSVNNVEATAIKCYPNPATNNVVVDGLTSQVNHLVLINLFGQIIKPTYSFDGEKCNINISNLSTGTYFVYAVENGKEMKTMFIKN